MSQLPRRCFPENSIRAMQIGTSSITHNNKVPDFGIAGNAHHLGFGDDLDSNGLPLARPLLDLGGAGVAEVSSPDLITYLVLGREPLTEPEPLVEPPAAAVALGATLLGDGRPRRPVPPRERRPDVLSG